MLCRALGSLVLVAMLGASSAHAQEDDDGPVHDTAAAAEAYDRGAAAFLRSDWARASEYFIIAYRLSPAAPALIQALRAGRRAGNPIRAANIALWLSRLHADVPEASALADEVLAEHQSDYLMVEVEDCPECEMLVDGRLKMYPAAFVTAGTDHEVVVNFEGASESHTVRGRPGQRQALSRPDPSTASEGGGDTDRPVTGGGGSGGLSPWVFGVSLALTLAAGGVLIWSGVDTLDGVDAFNAMPTREAFEEGESKELRTNVMIGVTAGLGVLAVVFALLTDWDGDPEPDRTTGGAFFDGTSGGVWLRAAF